MRPFRISRVFWKAAAVLELPVGALDSSCTVVGDTLVFAWTAGRQAKDQYVRTN